MAGQITAQPAMPSSSTSPAPTDPDVGNYLNAAYTSSSSGVPMPTTSDNAPQPASNNSNREGTSGVFNYYFLLLAVFVIIVALVWLSLIRRNRQKLALSRHNGQTALARDLEGTPGGRRWGPGRWRFPRPEEGLDERGQAPPPYMPAPLDATVHPNATHNEPGAGQAIPLQDLSGLEQKPPDYDEHLAPTPDTAETGPSTQPSLEPNNWYSNWYRNRPARNGAKPDIQ